ncbi:hypothetical protein JTB14_018994 [Gonioctena quinquepunctata]|nr:hypothetical protein JTB14_018994 [Gonioctena quinquepunctata]
MDISNIITFSQPSQVLEDGLDNFSNSHRYRHIQKRQLGKAFRTDSEKFRDCSAIELSEKEEIGRAHCQRGDRIHTIPPVAETRKWKHAPDIDRRFVYAGHKIFKTRAS